MSIYHSTTELLFCSKCMDMFYVYALTPIYFKNQFDYLHLICFQFNVGFPCNLR